jgi:hypothetical protein
MLRLLGLVALALALVFGWLFRSEILAAMGPMLHRLIEAANPASGRPNPRALERARDKVDSLNGWHADSVVLSAGEMASLLDAGLSPGARRHLDSMRLMLSNGEVVVSVRVETSAFPRDQLGPLAGALADWEPVRVSGVLRAAGPGRGEWLVHSLTIRGLTLSQPESADLLAGAVEGKAGGVVPFALPPGVAEFRIRTGGVTLYRERAS